VGGASLFVAAVRKIGIRQIRPHQGYVAHRG
jgi:hypothetical protein